MAGVVRRKYTIIGTPHAGTHTLGNWQSDNAVDLAIPVGTPIYAAADGEIGPGVGALGKGGRYAGLRFTLVGKKVSFWYGHLSKLVIKAGQHVKKGQLVGYSGSANGVAHLHFAVYAGDPRDYLNFKEQPKGQPAPSEPTLVTQPEMGGWSSQLAQEKAQEARLEDIESHTSQPGDIAPTYQPFDVLETWRMLANDPMASPETKRIASRFTTNG